MRGEEEILRPRNDPESLEKARRIAAQVVGGGVSHVQNGVQQEVARAANAHTEVLHGTEHAERLAQRHNGLCRGESIVLATELKAGNPQRLQALHDANPQLWISLMQEMGVEGLDPHSSDALRFMGEVAKRRGYFLMHYTPDKEAEVLQDPLCVVTEASAAHPDAPDQIAPVADCQTRLAPADPNSDLWSFLEKPLKMDPIFCDQMLKQMKERPWSVGLVEDIACQDTHPLSGHQINDFGCAGDARRANFHHIESVVNPQRGECPIRFIGASIASVQGIICPDGTVIKLGDLGESSIKNDRSILIHSEGRNPAKLVYKLQDRPVSIPIGNNGELEYTAIVNWYMYVHDLQHFDAKARAALAGNSAHERHGAR